MKTNHIIILAAFLFLLTFVSESRCESTDDVTFSAEELKQDQFSNVKSQIGGLLEENKRLEVQYSLLQKELVDLSSQIAQHKNEIAALQTKMGLTTSVEDENSLSNDTAKMKNDILVLRSKNNLLKTKLANLDEKINARKLQISNLNYQKSSLEIDQKMKNFQIHDTQEKSVVTLDQMKNDLEKSLQEEKETINKIAQMQQEKETFPQRIEDLKKENQELQDKVSQLEKDQEFKLRENAILKDKKYLEEQLSARALDAKREEKMKLKIKIEGMEQEYNELNQKVETTLVAKNKTAEITKDVIRIDKENQELRDRIDALKTKLEGLNHDFR